MPDVHDSLPEQVSASSLFRIEKFAAVHPSEYLLLEEYDQVRERCSKQGERQDDDDWLDKTNSRCIFGLMRRFSDGFVGEDKFCLFLWTFFV